MAFPAVLFAIALASTVGPRLDGVTLGIFSKGALTLVFVIALFGWYYPARVVRAQVLSLREKEFIEAARMTGASDSRIIRSHILPHLVGPIIVYSTLIVATNILLEAGLSFLNVGIKQPDPELGEPAVERAAVLHHSAVADGLARSRRPPDHTRLQLARRRPPRCFRPAGDPLSMHPPPGAPPAHAHEKWTLRQPRANQADAERHNHQPAPATVRGRSNPEGVQ